MNVKERAIVLKRKRLRFDKSNDFCLRPNRFKILCCRT